MPDETKAAIAAPHHPMSWAEAVVRIVQTLVLASVALPLALHKEIPGSVALAAVAASVAPGARRLLKAAHRGRES